MELIQKKNVFQGPLLIIIAALLWAFDGIIRRHLYTLSPIVIIFFEHCVGLLLIAPFVLKGLAKEKLDKKSLGLLIVVAILSGLLGTLWFTTALLKVHFISFSVVFLLQKLQPLFAITSASVFLKEKISRKYIQWAIVALMAAFFVTFANGHISMTTGKETVVAALYALGAAFAWGTSTTFSKMILTKVSTKVSTFYRFLFTTVISLGVVLIGGYTHVLQTVTPPQIGLFILIAFSTGLVALMIYYKGLAKTPVHISTILELTFPFIAILIDITIYKTTLVFSQYLAALLLTYAIYKIARLQSYASSSKAN